MASCPVRRDGRGGHPATCALIAALAAAPAFAEPAMPAPPQAFVDTAMPSLDGRTIEVPATGDLRAALERARRGDTIVLQPGVVYRGPFTLPAKRGDGWIVITTAGADSTLPPAGERVGREHVPHMAVLESRHGAVITAAPGASHYRFVGVHLRPQAGTFLHNLVELGSRARTLDELPHHVVFDRCVLLGDPEAGTRRGIALNSRASAVIDSHLAGFKEQGADSQAIAGWNGPGPFSIVNNYLEGAGENILFGGETALIDGLVPSDIEVRGNHLAKPLSWKQGHPDYAGTPWTVKNLFELKNARRVVVDGNLMEYSWVHGQTGFAVLFTVRTEDGRMPWAVVEDVAFTNNVIRHAGGGISFLGRDRDGGQTQRVLVANNLFDDIGGDWGGGRLFQMIEGTRDVVIRNNTARQTGSIVVADEAPHHGFVFERNAMPHNEYGIVGAGTLPGSQTLERHFPGAVVEGNTFEGGSSRAYPQGNRFTRTIADEGMNPSRLCRAMEVGSPRPELTICQG